MHEMKLKKEYFNLIKNKIKTIEIRLNDEKRKKIKVGDKIKFTNFSTEEEFIFCEVEKLLKFNSFEDMTNILPHENIGMKNLSNKEIIDIYHEFYTKSDETKYGVLAIYIKLL